MIIMNMKKKKNSTVFAAAFAAVLMTALLCVLSGCGGTKTNSGSGEKPENIVTVTDHNGNVVSVPEKIERIAVCDIYPLPSVLSIFFDSADKIVAMAPPSMAAAKNGLLSVLYPEILKADTMAISAADVNTEELMALDPQVVFYSASNSAIGEKLTRAGFNAVAISASKWEFNAVETLSQWIDLLSQIFPEAASGRAELVREYSRQALETIAERTEKLTEEERRKIFFLFQYSEDSLVTAGQRAFGQWWADAIGAVNTAAELSDDLSAKVTMEQVYLWNPEMILVSNFTTAYPEDLYQNTVGNYDWSGIDAVARRQVYKMPLGMYRSYTAGIDTPVTLFWLAKTVYPELFEDIDVTEKTMEYYETVFGVKLTEEQAASIFAPPADAGILGN